MKKLWHSLWRGTLVLLVASAPAVAGPRVEPSAEALEVVRNLRARSMGVDGAGNLWAWKSGPGVVDVIAPSGDVVTRYSVPQASAVDVSAEQGLVGLFVEGLILRWFSRDGAPAGEARLDGQAMDVRWLGPDRVALTPQTAPHRIEIWDLKSKKRLETWGREVALKPGIGATRMRGVFLAWDPERKLLYSLESYTGDLQVWSSDGKLAWSGQIENPTRRKSDEWLARIDQEARKDRDIQTPLIKSFKMAVGPGGDLWVGFDSSRERREAVLVKMGPQGNETKVIREEPCPSLDFTFWGGWLIFYRSPIHPEVCVGTRRFP